MSDAGQLDLIMMNENATFRSCWAGESQAVNPIDSALVNQTGPKFHDGETVAHSAVKESFNIWYTLIKITNMVCINTAMGLQCSYKPS